MHSLTGAAAVAAATIQVERINGPVLLISGADDRVWFSATMADRIVERLRDRAFAFAVSTPLRVCRSRGADATLGGSAIRQAVAAPQSGEAGVGRLEMGGTPEGNLRARTESWPRLVSFLRSRLAPAPF